MVTTKAHLFHEVSKRNELRRTSGLPLLNMRDEIEKQQNVLDWKNFADICQQNQAVRDRIETRIRAELAVEGFDCLSSGGRMMLNIKVQKEFHGVLRGIGVKIPTAKGTHYGPQS